MLAVYLKFALRLNKWRWFIVTITDDDDEYVKSPSSTSGSARDIQSDDLSSMDDVSDSLS